MGLPNRAFRSRYHRGYHIGYFPLAPAVLPCSKSSKRCRVFLPAKLGTVAPKRNKPELSARARRDVLTKAVYLFGRVDPDVSGVKNRIAILRKERGLTLAAVAAAAGTTKAQIQKLERGERRLSLDWMERVAGAMGVKITDLLPVNEIACQHGPAETEILKIIRQLPEEDRVVLVQVAKELMGTLRRIEGTKTETPRPAKRAGGKAR